jgi:hypothetical protein
MKLLMSVMYTGVGYVLTASVCLGRGLTESGLIVKPAHATVLLLNWNFSGHWMMLLFPIRDN